ncbi:MAG TPA: 30S ribosomal protein S1 [Spirochaetia bacterium]|nr:30S ribosomal protein S1 [Spirochaetales bacterium]HQK33493.1 30S ribosomal protein S1 [Spirochaetales bacterium]HRS65334.1 30S ribosomal protein S1 [Spirochaetia bacterium]
MIVAIDGPAGTGKSTIAHLVAERLGFLHVNSGNYYRTIAVWALEHAIDYHDTAKLVASLKAITITYSEQKVLLNGTDITHKLHTDAVDAIVAQISAIKEIRLYVNEQLRMLAVDHDIVMEGRDITTVVFPNAEVKIYLDASPDARALRRYNQGTSTMSLDEIKNAIIARDTIDKNKEFGSLTVAPDAYYIDTSYLTIDEVYEKVYNKIQLQGKHMDKEVVMNDSNPSEETIQTQLQEAYLRNLDTVTEGTLVEGKVVQVTSDSVFVDVGTKSEGRIDIKEFTTLPKVGDTVTVLLLKKESRNGESIISKQKADEKLYWKAFTDAYKNHKTVEGTITTEIKGGYDVDLGFGLKGFLPVSKAYCSKEELENLIGCKSHFYIERLYSDRRVNIVLNRKRWLEEQNEKNKAEFFATVKEGDVVKGVVKSYTSFGAFIDLGGFDGLLHINDMSWGHVTRPKDFVKKGQTIEVKVIKLDPAEGRINLSLKHFTQDPWENFENKYHLHDIVKGKVTKFTDYGAFIELEEGIEGLAHISEFSWVKRIKKPQEMLKLGDIVSCKILGYDLDQQKVSLSLKEVQENPWETIEQRYPEGKVVTGKVVKLTNAGAFVNLEEGIDGFLPFEELSWTAKGKASSNSLQVDQEIQAIVTESSAAQQNIRLSVKKMSENPWESLAKAYKVGSIIEGTVSSITDFGAFVKVQGDIEGLLHKSNLVLQDNESTDDALKKLTPGTKITAAIIELYPQKQKLALSLKDLAKQQQQAEFSKFMEDAGTNSDSYTLGDLLKGKGGK